MVNPQNTHIVTSWDSAVAITEKNSHFPRVIFASFVKEKVQVCQQTEGGIEREMRGKLSTSVCAPENQVEIHDLCKFSKAKWQTLLEI